MPASLPIPLRRQGSEGDCLPACVQLVLDYWGRPTSRESLIAQLGTDPEIGTPASRVLALQFTGLAATYRPAGENHLRNWLARGIPVIVLVDTGELLYWARRAAHALVLVGLEGSTAYVNDPAFDSAPLPLGLGDLLLASDAMGNMVAVIAPGGREG